MNTFITAVVDDEEVQITPPYYRTPSSPLYMDIVIENQMRLSIPVKQVRKIVDFFLAIGRSGGEK